MPTFSRRTARAGVTLPLAALLALAACSDGDSSHPGRSAAPAVSSTSPAIAATGVPVNRKLTATFSESMDPATLATAFQLTGPFLAPVAGTVSYVGSSRIATFVPLADLEPGTAYTATVTTGAKSAAGRSLPGAFVWTFTTALTPDNTAPAVISSVPAASPPATGVATNARITATFSEGMDPLTITSGTFLLREGNNGPNPVAGSVTYAGAGSTATFTPASHLAAGTVFTATIVTAAADLAGNPLAAEYVWTFTTGAGPDVIAPAVASTNPTANATAVALNKKVNATFDEAMDPTSLSTATFEVAGPDGIPIAGTVSVDATNRIATFTPAADLAASTLFDARILSGARDIAGNALASAHAWKFTTGTQLAPGPFDLRSATPFGGSGGGAGMTNQGLLTVVNGDVLTTGISTSITGFHDHTDSYTETGSNAGFVNGTIFTDVPPPGTPERKLVADQALADAQATFLALSPAALPGGIDVGDGELGGRTLPPGVYKSAPGTYAITLVDLTLDGQGDANATWVFQMASSLTVGNAVGPRSVLLVNGAQAKNVFWQVGSAATINAAGGGTMVGTIIAQSGAAFSTAGEVDIVTLNGRALGLAASVTLVNTVINVPLE